MRFVFTKYAERQWKKLPSVEQDRLRAKLLFLGSAENFAKNAKRVLEIPPATHRLRIGNYRLLIRYEKSQEECLVLKIGHRKEIYQ